MKSRSTELLDRAIYAMAAAIEIYNKPGFPYRSESFVILATNAWELVLKAKWLIINDNNRRSFYIYDYRQTKQGRSKRKYIRRTDSGTPQTVGIRYVSRKLVEKKLLDQKALSNIEAMLEFRNSASHFYNVSQRFDARLHEIGAACVRNFAQVVDEWFGRSISEFSIFLMPFTFVDLPSFDDAILKADEQSFLDFLDQLDSTEADVNTPYSVAINVGLTFTRSIAKKAIPVKRSRDPAAVPVVLTEEDVRILYPWDYTRLTAECRKRYSDFKANQEYHDLRHQLQADDRFGHVRYLDPGNPKSQVKVLFSHNIIMEFDKCYSRTSQHR